MNGRAAWIAWRTIVVRELVRFARIWMQTILPPMITTTLYFLIFGGLIGSRIGEMDGLRYMDFIVPGIILMTVITNSYANVVSSFYSAKFQRHIEELMVAPVPPGLIVLGYVTGGVGRGIAVGAAVTLVSTFFSPLQVHNAAVLFSVLVLTATLFSIGGLINAIFAKSFDDISIVPTFVLMPLTYLGGVFYSISLLPEFWQKASLLNPILHMVNAFRYGMIGRTDIGLGFSYAIMLGSIAILFTVAVRLVGRGQGIRS